MTKLSDDLKRKLDSLADQDAGENLSRNKKLNVLHQDSKAKTFPGEFVHQGSFISIKSSEAEKNQVVSSDTKYIALVCFDEINDSVIDYSIDSCVRQNARLDIILNKTVNNNKIKGINNRIQDTDVHVQIYQMDICNNNSIYEYVNRHPSLVCIISNSEDQGIDTFVDNAALKRNRINVPIVLVKNKATTGTIRNTEV